MHSLALGATDATDAWSALYTDAFPLLYRTAAFIVGAADAEDVVQETFAIAMRDPTFFTTVREPIAWLRTAVVRRALSRRRHVLAFGRIRARLGQSARGERASVELEEALAHLAPRDRAALVLRYFHRARYDEIAQALGVAASSVGPILARAKARLEEELR